MQVKVKKINNGYIPVFKRDGDACADCYSNISVAIASKSRVIIPLGFSLEIPEGYEGVIRPRSGMTSKEIDAAIGTIDSNYRGELKVVIINDSDKKITISKGDRICQLAIRKTEHITFEEVDELSETERGSNGFGSSGMRG